MAQADPDSTWTDCGSMNWPQSSVSASFPAPPGKPGYYGPGYGYYGPRYGYYDDGYAYYRPYYRHHHYYRHYW